MKQKVFLAFMLLIGGMLGGCIERPPVSEGAASPSNPIVLIVEDAGEPFGQRFFTGLSGRETFEGGMLFDFGQTVTTGFQMRETLLPLSIAFISGSGVIVDIRDMEPLSDETYQSKEPYRYAVETHQGFFAEGGIAIGDGARIEKQADGTAVITFFRRH